MNIVVGSAFRNCAGSVRRYFQQLEALQRHAGPDHRVEAIAVEGDSTDRTIDAIKKEAWRANIHLRLIHCNHGGPVFGSTEQPERMAALSKVGNTILEAVRGFDDVLVYVESDLLWGVHTIGSLIDIAYERRGGFDIVAPKVMAGGAFYDTWAFRKNGTRFRSLGAPYHDDLKGEFIEDIDSAGSCLVMRQEVADKCRIRNSGALVDWCADAKTQGFRLGYVSQFQVTHP